MFNQDRQTQRRWDDLKDSRYVELWLERFGLFEMEISSYLRQEGARFGTKRLTGTINKVRISDLADELFGKSHVPHSIGLKKRVNLYHTGMQYGMAGVPRFLHEAAASEVPLLQARLVRKAVEMPGGYIPAEHGLGAWDIGRQLESLRRRKLIEVVKHYVYPSPVSLEIFSEENTALFKRLMEWKPHKTRVFRDYSGKSGHEKL